MLHACLPLWKVYITRISILVKAFVCTNYYPLLILFYLGYWKRWKFVASKSKLFFQTFKRKLQTLIVEKLENWNCVNMWMHVEACESMWTLTYFFWEKHGIHPILMPLLATYDFTCWDEVVKTMALNWRWFYNWFRGNARSEALESANRMPKRNKGGKPLVKKLPELLNFPNGLLNDTFPVFGTHFFSHLQSHGIDTEIQPKSGAPQISCWKSSFMWFILVLDCL